MSSDPGPTPVLLLSCPDQPGVVAATADFVDRHGGNIVDLLARSRRGELASTSRS